MSGFKELNDYMNKTIMYLLESDNLCKLLEYAQRDALNKPNLTQEEKINLIMKNIFPFNYIPEDDKEKVIVDIILEDFENEGSIYFKKGFITINIICHSSLWSVMDGLRPFLIMEELESKFNKLHNKENNIGFGTTFSGANYLWCNSQYSGYSVRYKACNMS